MRSNSSNCRTSADSIANVVTQEKRLELEQGQMQLKTQQYDDAAKKALQLGNEDLARQALERKQAFASADFAISIHRSSS